MEKTLAWIINLSQTLPILNGHLQTAISGPPNSNHMTLRPLRCSHPNETAKQRAHYFPKYGEEKSIGFWQDRLPLGKLTTLDGDLGLGKSFLALDIAARVSTGREMPDGTPGIASGAGVVLIAPEDGLADTIYPRLQRAGADLSRIISIGTILVTHPRTDDTDERPFRLTQDLMTLLEAIKRVQARLVIIDPLTAIFGSRGSYKDTEVRAALAPVQMVIEHFGAACLILRHPTKGSSYNPLSRPSRLLPFIPIVPSGLMVFRDPTDESKRVLVHIKANLSAQAPNLSFSIASDENSGDDLPFIRWHGASLQTLQNSSTHLYL